MAKNARDVEPDRRAGGKFEMDRLIRGTDRQQRQYPAIAIGSTNGAAIHLCAALGIPWLPQNLLVLVRRDGLDPDEPRKIMESGREVAESLLAAAPEMALHHMVDPTQDRLMGREALYFRLKRLKLGRAYESFIARHLAPGGILFTIECDLRWPVKRVADRHVFQFGGVGGLSPDEYLRGSERVTTLWVEAEPVLLRGRVKSTEVEFSGELPPPSDDDPITRMNKALPRRRAPLRGRARLQNPAPSIRDAGGFEPRRRRSLPLVVRPSIARRGEASARRRIVLPDRSLVRHQNRLHSLLDRLQCRGLHRSSGTLSRPLASVRRHLHGDLLERHPLARPRSHRTLALGFGARQRAGTAPRRGPSALPKGFSGLLSLSPRHAEHSISRRESPSRRSRAPRPTG